LEQAKHYGRLLAEKENVIRTLRRSCEERETVIRELTAATTTFTAKMRQLGRASRAFMREKISRPFNAWLFRRVVDDHWMQIGVLQHYDAKPLRWDERLPKPQLRDAALPQIGIVTPSYGQERFVERTILSVLEQHYPKLRYVVQDGASTDRSPEIIARHVGRLHHWESTKDQGQADAISRGFRHIDGTLGPEDVMAWLNSDDLLGPGVLRFVAEYFARHPQIDAVYGHRIIIDDDDRDIGRWVMPRHDRATLEWIDYVPQETLFWRKRAWDLVGGIDPTYQFALDWDLLARFQQAGCRIVRLPYFLGAFRVHAQQKTSQAIHTTGAEEMRRIRTRFHGEKQDNPEMIEQHARKTRFWGAITARLHEVGIRW
jgi:GT2 family glycosyltransferase